MKRERKTSTPIVVVIQMLFLLAIAARAQDARVEIISDEINKNRAEIERFDPAAGGKMVDRGFKDWVTLAVSPRARAEYYRQDRFNPSQQAKLDPVLNSLAEAISKKMAGFKPDAGKFAFRRPAEEKLMMGQLKVSATRKIFKIGLSQSNWEIYKNSLGLPSYRFKRGYIWARDSADDHPYCKLYYISIVQNYAGGGTYGESSATYEETNLTGCP